MINDFYEDESSAILREFRDHVMKYMYKYFY